MGLELADLGRGVRRACLTDRRLLARPSGVGPGIRDAAEAAVGTGDDEVLGGRIAGRVCRTALRMTAEEAARFPRAERIEGTLVLRQVDVPSGGSGMFRRRASGRVSRPV